MNIHVHVERLVLEGLALSKAEGAQVQATLEAEIGRSLSVSPLPKELRDGSATNVKTAVVDLGASNNPVEIGRRISHAVCRSLALQPAPPDTRGHQATARGKRP